MLYSHRFHPAFTMLSCCFHIIVLAVKYLLSATKKKKDQK